MKAVWNSVLASAVVCGATLTGCVDKEKCDEALRVTRDAVAKEQTDIARQWRDRAWKICNDSAVTQPLDKEITDKEAEIAKRTQDLAKQVADAAQKRMTTAAAVWRSFDAEDEKSRTEGRLEDYRAKAAQMAEGLPPEYAQQVQAYNAREYARRKALVEESAKKP